MSKPFTPEQIDAAMRRAAKSARDLAKQTGTKLALWRDGHVVHVDPDELPDELFAPKTPSANPT